MHKLALPFLLLIVIAVIGGCGNGGETGTPTPSGLEAQAREEAEVTVTVTPQDLGESATNWTFKLVLDTHTVELSQNPAQVSVLVAGGKEYAAVAWEGDEPGGHHLEGILKFPAVSPRPRQIELKIREIGGIERSFNWTLDVSDE